MGDGTKVYSDQFTAAAQAAVEDGMTGTIARTYPLAAGVGNLGSTGGEGLQYTIAPTLLDLKALQLLDTNGNFCGTGANYNAVKGQLAQFLLSWNTANPNARADRVVGVIDPKIALGPPSPCFEGMAVLGSTQAWAQAITGRAGQLLGLELAHTLNMTPPDRESPFDAGHSQNVTAENPVANRRYNIVQRAFIPTERSLMKPSASAPAPDNNNTLFEVPDYAYGRCILGGTANSECTTYPIPTVGTQTAATLAFVMSGTTDGTRAGTAVVESYFSSTVPLTTPDAGSIYTLRQKTPAGNVDSGVPVRFSHSEHGGNSHSETVAIGLFAIAHAFDPNATRIELWKGTPGSGVLLYERDRSDTPVITSMSAGTPTPVGRRASLSVKTGHLTGSVPFPAAQTAKPVRTERRSSSTASRWPLSSSMALVTSFQVNSTGDAGDANLTDGSCNDGTGSCTLRAAIQQANSTPGADTIAFNIAGTGVQTFTPASELPSITEALTIDGSSQGGPGYTGPPLIELDGTLAGSTANGLVVQGSASGTILRGMIINRFQQAGLQLLGSATIEGNYIGTDQTGTSDLGNKSRGIWVLSPNNVIGGSTPNKRNVIAGNDFLGIALETQGNVVRGNYIGTDVTGTLSLGNCVAGVDVTADANTIGGTSSADRNVISGYGGAGCAVASAGIRIYRPSGNHIEGNYIGINPTATAALPGASLGVFILGGSNNVIGGAAPGAGNVIAGNSENVHIQSGDVPTVGNVVQGNYIGTTPADTIGFGGATGVAVAGATGTIIGGTNAGEFNLIARNPGIGVYVTDGTGNVIRFNRIHDNGALGIDLPPLNGITPNDHNDSDTGANNIQNFPLVTSATLSTGNTLVIDGTLNSVPNNTFSVDIYANPSCDSSGNGEGAAPLGSASAVVGDGGDGTFEFVSENQASSAGLWISVTATDSAGNTSEFSPCVQVSGGGGGGGGALAVNSNNDVDDGACNASHCSLREAINAANANSGADTITFDIGAVGSSQAIALTSSLPAITDSVFVDGWSQRPRLRRPAADRAQRLVGARRWDPHHLG